MSDLFAFVRLGVGHIVSLDAMDHLLFLLALTIVYRPRDWRAPSYGSVRTYTAGTSMHGRSTRRATYRPRDVRCAARCAWVRRIGCWRATAR